MNGGQQEDQVTTYAAGCVVYRRQKGQLELLVVHRQRYDDWSFPKGKRDKGETDMACAVREVEEETGFTGEVGAELSPSYYQVAPRGKRKSAKSDADSQSELKVVRWWLMEQTGGEFSVNDEVDKICWVGFDQAAELLSYEQDQALLGESALVDMTSVTSE